MIPPARGFRTRPGARRGYGSGQALRPFRRGESRRRVDRGGASGGGECGTRGPHGEGEGRRNTAGPRPDRLTPGRRPTPRGSLAPVPAGRATPCRIGRVATRSGG